MEGVPGLDGVIAVDDKPSRKAFLSDLRFLWHRFDWALCALTSARSLAYGTAAGKRRVMINEGGFWRHLVITNLVPPTTVPRHRLDENERLLALVARAYRRKYLPLLKSVAPTAPLPDDAGTWTSDGPYAVLHLCGKYSDKDVSQMVWHRLAQHLTSKGLRLAFTGGGGEVEEN